MHFVDLKTQYEKYRQEIDERIQRVLRHGQYIQGPEVDEVEAALARFVGVRHCVAVSSGTMSLEVALRALGVGPGDEVITVPFTWISTAEVIGLVGAKPVFVDIEERSYNMDIGQVEGAITPRTKAIIPVSLFGQMPDLHRLNQLCEPRGICVIEDAAQSFGATRNGKRSCSASRIASTSFFPAKPLGCYGDGGALFTDDNALAQQFMDIRAHGGKRHHHTCLGTNGRFDTLQAAVLLAKLPHFEDEIAQRSAHGALYSSLLHDVCLVPEVEHGNTHIYAQYTIRVPERDALMQSLQRRGIPTAIYYPKCLHEQPVFESLGYGPGSFPRAEAASREVLSLPMHPWLTHGEIQDIANHVKSLVRRGAAAI